MAKKDLRGKVIRILDTRTVIINLGAEDGITDSSIFNILGEPETVIDPFTKQELGKVLVVKAKLKTSQVYEKFTIATTKWIQSNFKLFSGIQNMFEVETIDEGELLVKKEDIQPWKARSNSPVKVGDEVSVEVVISEIEPNAITKSLKDKSDHSAEQI